MLLDNNQREISLAVPSNCCGKIRFSRRRASHYCFFFFFLNNKFDISDAGCVSAVLHGCFCISREVFEKMLVNLQISVGTKC